MTQGKLAAISIDLDEIGCYHAIHGLTEPTLALRHVIYDRAIPRFEQLLDDREIRATFFCVGRDLSYAPNADAIRRLHTSGHEIANHTYSHRYDFSRGPNEEIYREVEQGIDAIARVTGERPIGFRAPGYTINQRVLDVLTALGVSYDSSVFPSPWYYLAKAAALGFMRLRGKRSRSILDTPHMLRAPGDPYQVGTPYWKRAQGLWELPIGVTRATTARFPYIGTSLILAGAVGSRFLTRCIAGRPLVNLELHGIDQIDADQDGIAYLKPFQPDLKKSLSHKVHCLSAAIDELQRLGYHFRPLKDAIPSNIAH
ncbi:MAG: polysaccharide deacetylase family protein [Myxococcales bacterium]|nr:polysaccharide deacetylase family protein [Myxococcales bacterium]MCB9709209.1 polysaccharide deacetylase family protein [Myxococcales bacterium]